MWGDTGVSSRHRWRGDTIGPRAENEYAVEPVGVATITPSAAYVVNERAVDRDVEPDDVARCCAFSSTASLSAVPAAGRRARRTSTVDREHHALLDLVVAGEQPRQRRASRSLGLDLGEVAELADVDAEHRARRRRTTRSTARSIVPSPPSEISDVETVAKLVGGSPPSRPSPTAPRPRSASGPRGRARTASRRRRAARSAAAARSWCGTSPTRASRPARRRPPAASRTTRRGRPSSTRPGRAPVGAARGTRRCRRRRAGATTMARHDASPAPPRPAPTSSSTARVHLGVADDPALADPRPARLELRLHQQHEVGVGASCSATSAGATVRTEMNERSATTTSTGPPSVAGVEGADVGLLVHRDPGSWRRRPWSWPRPTSTATTVRGAVLEQAVGEAAGRRPGVERTGVRRRRRAKRVERAVELVAAA